MKRTPMLVGVILPHRVDLRVRALADGRLRFRYVEIFPRRPGLRRLCLKTVAFMRRLLQEHVEHIAIRAWRDRITIEGIDSRHGVGALIAGEFAGWVSSGVGRLALAAAFREAPPASGMTDADLAAVNMEPSQLASYPDAPWEPAAKRKRP